MKLFLAALATLPLIILSRPTDDLYDYFTAIVNDAENSAKKAAKNVAATKKSQAENYINAGKKVLEQNEKVLNKAVENSGDSVIAAFDSLAEQGKNWLDQNGIKVKNVDGKVEAAKKILTEKKEALSETDWSSYLPDANYWLDSADEYLKSQGIEK